MFRRSMIPRCAGILVLSGMFLMGQDTWGPQRPPIGSMAQIPAGCYEMGDHFGEGEYDELPVHDVCISAFEMDVYMVTNGQYMACVYEGVCEAPWMWIPEYFDNPQYQDYPVFYVGPWGASAYCAWAGKRLPTEAEWEYAARGGLSGKRYPWGNFISGLHANYADAGETWDFGTSPVGHYAPNGYGLYDMAGNLFEWTGDLYCDAYYQFCVDHGIVNDPPGPAYGAHNNARGGSWSSPPYHLRVAYRLSPYIPPHFYAFIGFRCAR